jgi:hypothetical protein
LNYLFFYRRLKYRDVRASYRYVTDAGYNCRFSTGEALETDRFKNLGTAGLLDFRKNCGMGCTHYNRKKYKFQAEFNRVSKSYSIDLERLAYCRKGGPGKKSRKIRMKRLGKRREPTEKLMDWAIQPAWRSISPNERIAEQGGRVAIF